MKSTDNGQYEPYVPADKVIPEVTFKAVVIGVILAMVFTMSSLYVGLKFARTVAASIPAALISLMIFKAFKKTSILENVVVQTIASAGESVAAMAAFCITAILLSGYWTSFHYLETMLILGLGGMLGVLLSIPLRRIMIIEEKLPYPEGIAVAEVLISGENKGNATRLLLRGSFVSALITFAQSGLKLGSDFVIYGTKAFGTVFGASIALSPLSLGAGYIIGLSSSAIMLVGGLIANFIVLPYLGARYGAELSIAEAVPFLVTIQKQYLRFIAVGVMIAGSLWSLVTILPMVKRAITLGLMSSKKLAVGTTSRVDKDIPFLVFVIGVLLVASGIGALFYNLLSDSVFTAGYRLIISAVAVLAILIIGFIMSSVASQLVGILGTTSLPASGLCLATIILFASLISPILLATGNNHISDLTMIGITLIFTSVVGAIMVLGGDNMQDLKTGYLIGATPWKQQAVLLIGVVASVVTTPFVLQTMFEAYGIGDLLPRPDMDPAKALSAPQGMLIFSVTKGLFGGQVPWSLLISGIIIAVIVIAADLLLGRFFKFRLPIMTFAAGFYLPIGISIAFFFGGLLRAIVAKAENSATAQENGVMVASGFIAGEAIMGALLSIPFALYKDSEIMALPLGLGGSAQDLIGIAVFIFSAIFFLRSTRAK